MKFELSIPMAWVICKFQGDHSVTVILIGAYILSICVLMLDLLGFALSLN
jgi:hypothetical protein